MGTLFVLGALVLAALILGHKDQDDGDISDERKAAVAAYSFWIEHIDKDDNEEILHFSCRPYFSEPGAFLSTCGDTKTTKKISSTHEI